MRQKQVKRIRRLVKALLAQEATKQGKLVSLKTGYKVIQHKLLANKKRPACVRPQIVMTPCYRKTVKQAKIRYKSNQRGV